MTGDPDFIPGTTVLRNSFEIADADELNEIERAVVAQRAAQGVPSGDFGLAHHRAIHRHLFQDVCAWAGEVRKVELAKGGPQFMFRATIANGMADAHRRIVAADSFKGLTRAAFADEAGGTWAASIMSIPSARATDGRSSSI